MKVGVQRVAAVDVDLVGLAEGVAGGGELEGDVEFGEECGGGEDFDADQPRQEIGDEVVPPVAELAMEVVDGRQEEDAGAAGGIEDVRRAGGVSLPVR